MSLFTLHVIFQALNSLHRTGGGKVGRVASGNKLKGIVRIFCKNALVLNVNLMLHAVKAKAHLTGFSLMVVIVFIARGHTLNSQPNAS